MYYDVLSADGREAVSAMFADTFRETRRIGGEFQVGAIDLDKRRERRQSDEAVEFCDDRLAPLYVVAQTAARSPGMSAARSRRTPRPRRRRRIAGETQRPRSSTPSSNFISRSRLLLKTPCQRPAEPETKRREKI